MVQHRHRRIADMANDHPLEETDSQAYQPVIDGEEGPSGDRGDDGPLMALSHPPFLPQ
jgi:hypothetical protein